MAKFHVNSTCIIEVQQSFIMFGQIREGAIRAGMLAKIKCNSSFSIVEVISRIEYARKNNGTEEVCLCFDCGSSEELAFWEEINIANETIDIDEVEA